MTPGSYYPVLEIKSQCTKHRRHLPCASRKLLSCTSYKHSRPTHLISPCQEFILVLQINHSKPLSHWTFGGKYGYFYASATRQIKYGKGKGQESSRPGLRPLRLPGHRQGEDWRHTSLDNDPRSTLSGPGPLFLFLFELLLHNTGEAWSCGPNFGSITNEI